MGSFMMGKKKKEMLENNLVKYINQSLVAVHESCLVYLPQ